MSRRAIRETVAFTIDGREVPARRDWHYSEGAPGGYDQATIYVPRRYGRGIDQGSVLKAWRSSGRPGFLGTMAAPPKIRQGMMKVEAQGPQIDAATTYFSANYQDRRYDQWISKDSDPFNLQANAQSIGLDATPGSLVFSVDKGQHIVSGAVSGYARWTPAQDITRLTFKQVVKAPSTGDNRAADYQIRLDTYTGPSSNHVSGVHDWNLVDGNVEDLTIGAGADMVTLMLRRTGADSTSTDDGLRLTLVLLAINGLAVGDTMFTSDIVRDLGSRTGYETRWGITGSGVNGLPFSRDPDSGPIADSLTYFTKLDGGWRWLVGEPVDPRFPAALRYGPFGDPYVEPSRSWRVSLEREADEQLDDVQVVNEVVQTWDQAPGIPRETIVHADPDPLGYTSLLRPDGSVMTVQQRLEKLNDLQADDTMAQTIARAALAKYSVRRVRGTVPVYELVGPAGPLSHLELHAGDLLELRDYETPRGVRPGPQDVVYVDHYEDHSDATLTDDVSIEGLLADLANRKARR